MGESNLKTTKKLVDLRYSSLLRETFEKYKSIGFQNNVKSLSYEIETGIKSLSDTDFLNSLVHKYLTSISEVFAQEFFKEFPPRDKIENHVDISIEYVVKKYMDNNNGDIVSGYQEDSVSKTKSKKGLPKGDKKQVGFHSRAPMRFFTADEDKILLDVLQSFPSAEAVPHIKVKELLKLTNRTKSVSIRARLKKLQRGHSKRTLRLFTLEEDKFIVDEAIVELKQAKKFNKLYLKIETTEKLGKYFKRDQYSVRSRWTTIRMWLLQYYNKTLNLEIRPMLANAIADNFESRESIDWKKLTTFPEFVGHTEESLRKSFDWIIYSYQKLFKIKRADIIKLPLKRIGEYAASEEWKRYAGAAKRIEKRQGELIDYFEGKVFVHNIKDYI